MDSETKYPTVDDKLEWLRKCVVEAQDLRKRGSEWDARESCKTIERIARRINAQIGS